MDIIWRGNSVIFISYPSRWNKKIDINVAVCRTIPSISEEANSSLPQCASFKDTDVVVRAIITVYPQSTVNNYSVKQHHQYMLLELIEDSSTRALLKIIV